MDQRALGLTWRVIAYSEALVACVFEGEEKLAREMARRIIGTPLKISVVGGGEHTIGSVIRAEVVEQL